MLVSLDKYNGHWLEKPFHSPQCPDATSTVVVVERDSGRGHLASDLGLKVVVTEGCG